MTTLTHAATLEQAELSAPWRSGASAPFPSALGQSPPAEEGAETQARTRAFLLLRFTLIIATAYLLLGQSEEMVLPRLAMGLLSLALLSNLYLAWARPAYLIRTAVSGGIIIADTVWVTAALLTSGQLTADFFYLYFFVLFLAAIGERLELIVLGALVISAAYLAALAATGGLVWTAMSLVRIPFLFVVAIFYGYFVERLRHQQRRAQEEAYAASRLERANRELAQAESTLRGANLELQKLNDLKSTFVSIVSHELRTPLTAIRNAVDLLPKAGALTPGQLRFTGIATRNLARLAAILDDLLTLSKIEAGRQNLNFGTVDLAALIEDVGSSFAAQATASGIRLSYDGSVTRDAVWADEARTAQVLSNLLSNALKFTPAGGEVSVSTRASGDRVEVTVEDTGRGIPATELERIFERFYQVEDALTRTTRGSGLGLSIARELVQAQGGELSVESQVGRGSHFRFTIPTASLRAQELAALDALLAEHRQHPFNSILVVEAGPETELGALARQARSWLPRLCDLVIEQPAWGRVILLLTTTDREGAKTVHRRLTGDFRSAEGVRVAVRGPATAPEDGTTAWQLVAALERLGEPAAATPAPCHDDSISATPAPPRRQAT